MKIMAGYGADELYCGYLAPEWARHYSNLEFERKGGVESNFTDLDELNKSVELAHRYNIPVFLALNGLYVRHQYPLLLKIIDKLRQIDFDAFIVADMGLILTLVERDIGKKLHISTGGTVFNTDAVGFYRRFSPERVILDRQLTIRQISGLVKRNPGVDFEAFIFSTICVHIDGFCTFMHSYGANREESIAHCSGLDPKLYFATTYDPEAFEDACSLRYAVKVYEQGRAASRKNNVMPAFYKRQMDGMACGICAMYDLNKAGVRAVKVVGRQVGRIRRLKSVEFVARARALLDADPAIKRKEFIRRCKDMYREVWEYKGRCKGNNCYHPSFARD